MVSQKKVRTAEELKKETERYPVVGVIDMFGLPASQLQEIRSKMRDKAVIRMSKKRVLKLVFEGSKKPGFRGLSEHLGAMPAVLFSKENPFKLARIIDESKTKTFAKPGTVATDSITIEAGPTDLPAGPAIGELQKIKIPANVQDGKIAVAKDTVVAKEGDEITPEVASVLAKLGIKPMEIGLNLICAWEDGVIYGKDLLFRPPEEYLEELRTAGRNAFNLTINIGYFTKGNLPILLSKAHGEAMALARSANIITKETVGDILSKAQDQAAALDAKVDWQKPAEEKTEKEREKEEVKPSEEKAEAENPPEEAAGPEAEENKTEEKQKTEKKEEVKAEGVKESRKQKEDTKPKPVEEEKEAKAEVDKRKEDRNKERPAEKTEEKVKKEREKEATEEEKKTEKKEERPEKPPEEEAEKPPEEEKAKETPEEAEKKKVKEETPEEKTGEPPKEKSKAQEKMPSEEAEKPPEEEKPEKEIKGEEKPAEGKGEKKKEEKPKKE